MNRKDIRILHVVVAFCIFFGLGAALAWPTLTYPMSYDDLHLIRPFSRSEIGASFYGNWDPDGIETPGFRPLTLLFNHIRYTLLGENVVAHRLFLICLYAAYLTMFCWIAYKLGMPWKFALVSGAMSLCARYNIYHYVWLADGIHLLQGCFFVFSLVLLIKFLDNSRYLPLLGSLLAVISGLLTREDTLATIPIIVLLGYAYTLYRTPDRRVRQMHIYTGTIIGLSIFFLAYRHFFVPEAQPLALNLAGFLINLVFTFSFMGLTYFDLLSRVLLYGYFVLFVAVVAGCIVYRASVLSRLSLLWLACAILACSSGLNIVRTNLLLFPITFISFFLGSLLSKVAKGAYLPKYALGMLAWLFVGSIYVSSVAIQSFHPFSAFTIEGNNEFIYGQYATKATIPSERYHKIKSQLAAVGIHSAADITHHYPKLVAEALQEKRQSPNASGEFFVPRIYGFNP